jgi:hypothetical protein
MRACRHDDVPSGGIVGGLIGAIDGPAIGQMRGGQIGGISSELLHSGCISPSTHSQVQAASARPLISKAMPTLRPNRTPLIGFPLRVWPRIDRLYDALTFVLYMFS